MAGPKPICPELEKQVCEAYRNGSNILTVAKTFRLNTVRATAILRKYGVPIKPKGGASSAKVRPPSDATKRCTRCLEVKPTAQYQLNPATSDGFDTRCSACANELKMMRRHGIVPDEPTGMDFFKCCARCGLWNITTKDFQGRKTGKRDAYCRICTKVIKDGFYLNNKGTILPKEKIKRWALRLEMIAAYGGKCSCCGESAPEFLTIDHVDGGGTSHQRSVGGPSGVIRELKAKGWPRDGFRLLCWNCNCTRGHFGACPHESPDAFIVEPKPATPIHVVKRCPICGETKPLAGFFKNPHSFNGASPYCKPCSITNRRERWQLLHSGKGFPTGPMGLGILRRCPRCELWKVKTEAFHAASAGKTGGFQGWCKGCTRIHRLQRREAVNQADSLRGKRLRFYLVQAYGGRCECCGEDRWPFLTVDHVFGGGTKARANGGPSGGYHMYAFLRRQGYPRGEYRLLCYNCNCSRGCYGRCPHQTG